MSYTLLNIADISIYPSPWSLGGNSNFIEFKAKSDSGKTEKQYISMSISYSDTNTESQSEFIIKTVNNGSFSFVGTKDKTKINDNTFYIGETDEITASNITYCLQRNIFLTSNYSIYNLITVSSGQMTASNIVNIIPYEVKEDTTITIDVTDSSVINTELVSMGSIDSDSISMGMDCDIELEIYNNPTDITDNMLSFGSLMGSLQKSYFGVPCWFDVNSIIKFSTPDSIDFLSSTNWVDTKSVRDFRIVAKRNLKTSHDVFFVSDILYSICGYSRGLETIDLDDYIYRSANDNHIKLQTNQPILFHHIGQIQYLNFLLDDDKSKTFDIGLRYKIYTQSRRLIATVDAKEQSNTLFSKSNTVNTELDSVIKDYAKAGYVEIYLIVDGEIRSNALSFMIMPECLSEPNDFAYLNPLGGWSTLNFGNGTSQEFKPTADTYYQTKNPKSNISSTLEGVYSKSIAETYTVTSSPLTAEMCDHFKEIAASVSVYEISTKRYIVVDDLTIKTNSKDELYKIEMKYRYSDKYNG